MATFSGTGANESITPTLVSGTVSTSGGTAPSGVADIILGGDGNDIINGGGGADQSYGGGGDDYIYAVLGLPETIVGGAGIDTLDTTIFTGNYVVNLATGLTNFAGESFTEMENLISGRGNDTLTGTAGANNINGGAGNDIIFGGDGNDTLNGGGGADESHGGNGDDYIYAVIGTPETIVGDAGIDTLDTTAFSGNYAVNLATGLTNFAGESFTQMENLISGSGNDTLTGTAGANIIKGGDGDDIIHGAGGADQSYGGNGNDYIYAVLGFPEIIVGGAGIDTLNTTAFTGDYVVNLATGLTNFIGESFTQMENIISGSGNDTLTGTAGANNINGGAGNDIINGGDGNDILNGGGGADQSYGGKGNDYIFAVIGTPETIVGGAGIDTLDTTLFSGSYVVNLATGLTNFAGESFTQMENLISGSGNDTLTGTAGANNINGGAGNDVINGAAGNDNINGGTGSDVINGGDGNDTLNGGGGSDQAYGGNGNDYIFAVIGTPETIVGGAGIDTLDTTSFSGNYVVNLATGLTNFAGESFTQMENLISGSGSDFLTGTAGANKINGGAGNDVIFGGDGNDTLNGGGGADESHGGNGDDYIYAVIGQPEIITGDAGIDTLDTTAYTGNYVVNLATGLTNLAAESFTQMENLVSGSGNDTLTGTAGANIIKGGDGNDIINSGGGADKSYGGNGNDALTGGAGNDFLYGGAGNDTLTGGGGNDHFVFDTAPASANADHITDFVHLGDVIDLAQSLFSAAGAIGTLAAAEFHAATSFSATDTAHILYNTSTGALLYNADGAGAGAAVRIAVIDNHATTSVTAADIHLV